MTWHGSHRNGNLREAQLAGETWMKRALRQRGMTQAELAEEAGVSPRLISDLVRMDRANFQPRSLRAIESSLGVRTGTLDEVLEGGDPPLPAKRSPGSTPHVRTIPPTARLANAEEVERVMSAVDLLAGREDASSAEFLELLEEVRPTLGHQQLGWLVDVTVTRALDELVAEHPEWRVQGARPDSGADIMLVSDGGEVLLVDARLTPLKGTIRVDEVIGRAVRSRAAWERRTGDPTHWWVVYSSDPGPHVEQAFRDGEVIMGWVGNLPELPSSREDVTARG